MLLVYSLFRPVHLQRQKEWLQSFSLSPTMTNNGLLLYFFCTDQTADTPTFIIESKTWDVSKSQEALFSCYVWINFQHIILGWLNTFSSYTLRIYVSFLVRLRRNFPGYCHLGTNKNIFELNRFKLSWMEKKNIVDFSYGIMFGDNFSHKLRYVNKHRLSFGKMAIFGFKHSIGDGSRWEIF